MTNALVPTNVNEAMQLAEIFSRSGMVPAEYRGKPDNCFIAIAWGAELGIAPIQAMQNIAVINGKPSIYGDLALAVVMGHSQCEDVVETIAGSGDKMVAKCTVKRRGRTPVTRTFSVDDAKTAKLWGKAGTWTQYPQRMLQMRARGFAIRDAFPDAMRGLITREEAQDSPAQPERDMGSVERVTITMDEAKALAKVAEDNGWTGDTIREKLEDMGVSRLTEVLKADKDKLEAAFNTALVDPYPGNVETETFASASPDVGDGDNMGMNT